MPHKVNPINFENAEANFGAANALLGFLATKLPISRLQRDLTDSSAQRTLGEALPHTVIGQKSLLKGLSKVSPDTDRIAEELNGEWSVLTEAVQTVMRRYRVAGAYEAIKSASRGKALDEAGYHELVEQLDVPEEAKKRLRELTPATYTGRAAELARDKVV
jgi:adenylosuccinate lyase